MGMMSVSYLTIAGEIIAENRNGVQSDYVPDSLGDTVALIGSGQTITDTWSYWPYGEIRFHNGPSPSAFAFVGARGYYQDTPGVQTYVRARILNPDLTNWQTIDPRWPSEPAYAYARSNPTSRSDRSGEGGPSSGFTCGAKVPPVGGLINWICKGAPEAAAKSEYCRNCKGLCETWCDDNYDDPYEQGQCEADCAKRASKCGGKKAPFPPKF